MLATNMVRMCCNPNGIALCTGTKPFSWYRLLIEASRKFNFFIRHPAYCSCSRNTIVPLDASMLSTIASDSSG